MLHYLLKVVDNSFAGVIILALMLLLLAKAFRGRHKLIVGWGLALGFAAALVYSILKRNTGFAVREFYDLGVILVSLLSLALVWLLAWRALKLKNKKNKDLYES